MNKNQQQQQHTECIGLFRFLFVETHAIHVLWHHITVVKRVFRYICGAQVNILISLINE